MDQIIVSQPVILAMEIGAALAAGICMVLLYGAIDAFLEVRKKVFELTGGNSFTLANKVAEVALAVRGGIEKVNARFTGNRRYQNIEKMLKQVDLADRYTKEYFMFGEEAAAISGFITVYALTNSAALGLLCAPVFFLLPGMVLKSKAEERKYALRRSIPNGLDIIAAYIEAGMSLPSAVIKYAKKSKSVFAGELCTASKQMDIGMSFSDAMKSMGDRLDSKDASTVVNAFIQAEKTGGSVREIIQSQADEIRKRHFMALKQQAHEAPVKLLLPMVLFIFPVVFIVLFGPIVIKLMHGF